MSTSTTLKFLSATAVGVGLGAYLLWARRRAAAKCDTEASTEAFAEAFEEDKCPDTLLLFSKIDVNRDHKEPNDDQPLKESDGKQNPTLLASGGSPHCDKAGGDCAKPPVFLNKTQLADWWVDHHH